MSNMQQLEHTEETTLSVHRKVTTYPTVMSVTGGKGGVGKSFTTANLAACLSQLGYRVLAIDTDSGLANLDVIMGVRVNKTLEDVLSQDGKLNEIITKSKTGVSIIPASSGVKRVESLSIVQKEILQEQIEGLEDVFDFILIDTPAGVSPYVAHWAQCSGLVLLVTTPEPTSLSDAYATMKILSKEYGENSFAFILNQAESEAQATRIYARLSQLADENMGVNLKFLGYIPSDEKVHLSIMQRCPVVQKYPFSNASQQVRQISQNILLQSADIPQKGSLQYFWKRLFNHSRCSLSAK